MKCPKCGLLNPPTALRCDCGWDFGSSTMRESYLTSTVQSLPDMASLGARLGGQILDSLIALAPVVVARLAYVISTSVGNLTLVSAVLYAFFYIWFADGFSNGQSYGKRILKTAVVDRSDGAPCTFGQSFVRNILLTILGPIDWIFIFGQRRQRLGDKAANTVVVKLPAVA